MGIFGWNGARNNPPLDGDDENRQHGALGRSERDVARDRDSEREDERLLAALFNVNAQDEYTRLFNALAFHLLTLLGAPSWWQRYTPAQRREAESLIRAHSAPLLAEVHETSGRVLSTQLDDQCVYCRRVLAEHGEPLPAVDWEFRAYGGYVCAAHLTRLSAHSDACRVIDEMLTPTPGFPRYGSVEIANKYKWGYLGERLADDQPFP